MGRRTRVILVSAALLAAPATAAATPGWVAPAATVSDFGANPAFTTAIASNARGDTAVAWQDPVTNHVWAAERPVGGAFTTGTELSTLADQALGSVDIDAAGNIYVFFVTQWMTNSASRPRVATKAIGDSTWTVTPIATASSTLPTFPPITGAVTPDGKALAIWFQGDSNNATLSKFVWSVKAAGSSTWSAKADIPGSTGNGGSNAHVVMNAAGQAAFVFASQNCGFTIRARGTTMSAANVWATANGLNTCSNNSINLAGGPVVGLDADGTATAAWSRDDAPSGGSGHPIVQFSSKQIDGTTWATTAASPTAADLSASGADALSPAIAVTPDGTTTVGWVRSGVIEERTRPALGGGFAALTVVPNTLTAPTGLLLAAGANDAAAALWTGTDAAAKSAVGAATRIPAGSVFTAAPSTPGTDNTAPALAIDDEGNAPGAWVHMATGQYAVQASGLDAAAPTLSGVNFPATADPGVAFSYTATATDRWSPNVVSWTFGDGTTGPGSGSKTYATDGNFVATLTAADGFGNTSSESHPITVGNPGAGGPGPGPGGGGGPAPDTLAPVFLNAKLTNTVFAVNPKGSAETPVTARRAKKGTTFRYTLSEVARVLFKIQRKAPGRKVGKKCRPPARSNRKKKKCTRLVTIGTFAQDGAAGSNAKTFSGRIGRKTLKPGSYQASLKARDAAGNVSAVKKLTFRVVRR